MPDFVDATVQDLDRRLGELHHEQQKLEAARAALVGSPRRPGRPPRTGRTVTTTTVDSPARTARAGRTTGRRPGRPRARRGGNTRSNQVLTLIRQTPGITVPQVAERLKIQPNYLYRVIPRLINDGLVTKDGKALHRAGE